MRQLKWRRRKKKDEKGQEKTVKYGRGRLTEKGRRERSRICIGDEEYEIGGR
jgi:hypothetical protein